MAKGDKQDPNGRAKEVPDPAESDPAESDPAKPDPAKPDPAPVSDDAAVGGSSKVKQESPPSPVGEHLVGRTWIVLLSLFLSALAGLLIVVLIQLWPASVGTSSGSSTSFVTNHVVLGVRANINLDTNLLLLALLAGALGGVLHSLRSIAWYVGERQLRWSWVLRYWCLPFVAAILALLFYLLIRGGLISAQGTTQDISPYGIAAIAGLVGLFSDQAAEMLKKVFTTVFAAEPKGSNNAPPTADKKADKKPADNNSADTDQ